MTGGGTTQLAGDAQQGCCTPREEAGPPRRGFIRGTAGRTKDDCDAHNQKKKKKQPKNKHFCQSRAIICNESKYCKVSL